jgi:hypothetical protein
MNVHWLLVLSGGNCSDQWVARLSLLIIVQLQLAKFMFLGGEYVHAHFMLQWRWGSGEKPSCGSRDRNCWNCVILGDEFKSQYLDYTQPPLPNMEVETLPHLCFTSCLFCCDLQLFLWMLLTYWYSVGCVWMQGECLFLGNRSPLGNMVLSGSLTYSIYKISTHLIITNVGKFRFIMPFYF